MLNKFFLLVIFYFSSFILTVDQFNQTQVNICLNVNATQSSDCTNLKFSGFKCCYYSMSTPYASSSCTPMSYVAATTAPVNITLPGNFSTTGGLYCSTSSNFIKTSSLVLLILAVLFV